MKKKNRLFMRQLAVAGFGLLLAASACSLEAPLSPPARPALVRLEQADYPDFYDDLDFVSLDYSLGQSLIYLRSLPPQRTFAFGADHYSSAHMIRSLERFGTFVQAHPSRRQLNRFIRAHYRVYRSSGRAATHDVLFTGYFQPTLQGSLTPTAEFRYPVYSRPPDLITIDLSQFAEKYRGQRLTGRLAGQTFVPYYDRRQIDGRSGFDSRGTELLWVKDRIDLFFLQIQGSGKVYLTNGQALYLHYQSSNGRPYRSIGKLLIDQGKIPRSQMSMQRIRTYLSTHPEEIDAVLGYNPSYVFFEVVPQGPLGYLEVRLTPGRSLAVDHRVFPMAGLAFADTRKPLIDGNGRIDAWAACRRFLLCQDTGGAIRGPGRADLFYGSGRYAEIAAGHMQQPGQLYFLVLKPG